MAGMTKKDREELDRRLNELEHYRKMSIEHCLNYGLTTKREELDKLRAEEAEAEAEAEAAEVEAAEPAEPAEPQKTELAHEISLALQEAQAIANALDHVLQRGELNPAAPDSNTRRAANIASAHANRLRQLLGDVERAK